MLKKLYDKNRILFSVLWIIAYCVLMSLGDALSSTLGVDKSISLAIGILLSAVLAYFLKKHGLLASYGLCRAKASPRIMLYYIPVAVMLTANLWYGVKVNYGAVETVFYIFTMLCVGFLEEVIFRGLLFNAMRKDSEKIAVAVSSLTFGIGHIINLFNGSGAQLIPNLLQIIYATSAGFMFVMIYCMSKSLVSCIVAHGVFNALSVFANDALTIKMRVVSCILLTFITASYSVYLCVMRRKRLTFNCYSDNDT